MASVRVSTASDTDLAARWAARLISRREGAMVMPMAVPHSFLRHVLLFVCSTGQPQERDTAGSFLFFPLLRKNALLNPAGSAII